MIMILCLGNIYKENLFLRLIEKTPPHHDAGRPDADAPISVKLVRESNLPLSSGRYAASVYGQWTEGEP